MNERTNRTIQAGEAGRRSRGVWRALGCAAMLLAANFWAQAQTFRGGIAGTVDGRALLILPARLTRWKGQLDFIEVVATLRRQGRAVHGLIAGAAHPRKRAFEGELRARVAALGLDDDISFLGQRGDLRELLAVSDIACSLTTEPEAFGRTTIEALSVGTPVVGYDYGGTGEILRAVYPAGLVPVGEAALNRAIELNGVAETDAAVDRAVKLSHEKYCSASAMLGKTAEMTTSFEIVAA